MGQYTTGWLVAGSAIMMAAAAAAATGAETYAKTCVSCHGADGRGNANMVKAMKVDASALDLTDAATRAESDADLIKDTTDGKGKMPPYGKKLGAADIAAVIAHVRTLGGGKPAATGSAPAAAGGAAATWTKSCKSCHGDDAKGNPKMLKALKVDAAAIDLTDAPTQGKSDADLTGIVTNGSANKKMTAFGKKLKPEEITGLVAYIRSLAGKR